MIQNKKQNIEDNTINIENNEFNQNLMQGYRKKLDKFMRVQKYILPYIFIVHQQNTKNYQQSNTRNINYEGRLCYQNGLPISLKKCKFCSLNFMKILPKFYYICRKTYQLKFNIQISITKQQQLSQEYLINYINNQIQINNQKLCQFLIKLGLIPNKYKNLNNLRNIYAMRVLKKQMNEIFSLHDHKNENNKINLQKQVKPINKPTKIQKQIEKETQKQYCKSVISETTNQSIVLSSTYMPENGKYLPQNISGNIQNISALQQLKTCCSKQKKQKKQDFQETNQHNNCITKIKNIQIVNGKNQKIQENVGGYFSVKNYNTILSIKNQEKAQICQNQMLQQKTLNKIQQNKNKDESNIFESRNISKIQEEISNTQIQQQQFLQNKVYKCNVKLAIKKLKKQCQGIPKYLQKMKHQKSIVRQIKASSYVCKYYEIQVENDQQNQNQIQVQMQKIKVNDSMSEQKKQNQQNNIKTQKQQAIYMQSLMLSLKQIQSKNIFCNQFQIIKQLIQAVCSLHENGIVHRDIKPGNIMFSEKGQLKLIDFSESIQCWRKYQKEQKNNANIGFTLPYSPIQCSTNNPAGYSNMKIDNWSVGHLPVCYSKSLSAHIKSGWPTEEFHWDMNLRVNHFNDLLILPLKFICIRMMNFKSEKRLCLQPVLNYLQNFQKLFF